MTAERSAVIPGGDSMKIQGKLANLQARYNDLEEEHTKLKEEMAERSTAHERLLMTVARLEKRNKIVVKRQAAQEEAFELERQEKTEVEKTLDNRIQQLEQELRLNLSSLERPTPPTPSLEVEEGYPAITETTDEQSFIAQVAVISQLRADLADMTESQLSLTEMHTRLQLRVHTLEHEVAERTAECYRLREENEGFEFLLRERTLDGRVYDADVFGDTSDDSAKETEGCEIFDQESWSAPAKGKSRSHSSERGFLQADGVRSKRKSQDLNFADDSGMKVMQFHAQAKSSPTCKCHVADGPPAAIDEKLAILPEEDPSITSLKVEIKALTDANKALRLYCSKILDKILLHDDEEHFLMDESGGMKRATGQQSVGSLISNGGQTEECQLEPSTPETYTRTLTIPERKAATPIALGSENAYASSANRRAMCKDGLAQSPGQHESRLRRRFSLVRSDISGRDEHGKADDAFGAVPSIGKSLSQDRKLDISEEDDEDRIERQRLATTLRLMGLHSEENESETVSPNDGSRLSNNETPDEAKPVSPFSRFSALFGRTADPSKASQIGGARPESPQMLSVPPLSSVHGRVIHRQEDGPGAETENPSSSLDQGARAKAHRQTISTYQTSNITEGLNSLRQSHRRTVGGDASLDTLWSLGSDGHDL